MKKKFFIESIILILLGFFSSLSLPPFNYILINFLTFSLLYILLIKIFEVSKNKKLFFLYGWLFGLGYFTSNLYWISISLTFDESFKFLIPLSIVLIPAFLALFYGLASFLFLILKPKKNLSSFFLFSLVFGTIEFIRSNTMLMIPELGGEPQLSPGLARARAQAYVRVCGFGQSGGPEALVRVHVATGAPGPIEHTPGPCPRPSA